MKDLKLGDPISFLDFVDEGWIIFFVIWKGVLQALTGILYFVSLILFFLCQSLFLGTCWLHKQVREWAPAMPAIFRMEESVE